MTDYAQTVETLAKGVIAASALHVDRNGDFPQESVDALSQAGLLGLLSSKEVGGLGESLRAAAHVVETVATECASTAMVLCMHYSATAIIEKHGTKDIRREIAAGRHLSTLAFSERGSRSQFWAPVSSATPENGAVRLTAEKSWVTSANHATTYVWSSRPVEADGISTLWLVPRKSSGLDINGRFDGLGLRGNDSTSVTAVGVCIDPANRLGDDGAGLNLMLETVMPTFNILSAATSLGLMRGSITAGVAHLSETRFEHLDSRLSELPTLRAQLAKMQIAADASACLLYDSVDAIENGREDTMLRVLESKASAGESAMKVTDRAMRICGGAAFRKEVGVERRFRDARASAVMAPTTDHLYDFIGKALCGMPVF